MASAETTDFESEQLFFQQLKKHGQLRGWTRELPRNVLEQPGGLPVLFLQSARRIQLSMERGLMIKNRNSTRSEAVAFQVGTPRCGVPARVVAGGTSLPERASCRADAFEIAEPLAGKSLGGAAATALPVKFGRAGAAALPHFRFFTGPNLPSNGVPL